MSDYQKILAAMRADLENMSPGQFADKLDTVCKMLDGIPSCYHDDAIFAAFNVKEDD